MKHHHVLTEKYPKAAPHLAALYTACKGGTRPINRTVAADSREKLAAVIGGEAAELLRAGGPILVKPRTAAVWLLADKSASKMKDEALANVLSNEQRAQGISSKVLADRAGLPQKTVYNALNAAASPSWWVLRAILTGLGKDLKWLAEAYEAETAK